MNYVVNLGNIDLELFEQQKAWLINQAGPEAEGLLGLLDRVTDGLAGRYDERAHLLTQDEEEPPKGIEASIPARFYRGDCYPRAETVGDLLCLLSELPAALPIDGDFGRSIEVYATNVGQGDLTSALHITDTSTPNDALIAWECAKEEGNDFYTRENCAYCDGDCHVNWLLYGDEAEHLCDEYQADSDDRYERGT